jgi:hypothetical protein
MLHNAAALQEKAKTVYATLIEHYGTPTFAGDEDPTDALIWTILDARPQPRGRIDAQPIHP